MYWSCYSLGKSWEGFCINLSYNFKVRIAVEFQATTENSGKVCEEKIHADEVKPIRLKIGYERKTYENKQMT